MKLTFHTTKQSWLNDLEYTYHIEHKHSTAPEIPSATTIIDGGKLFLWYLGIGVLTGIIQIGKRENIHKTPFEKFCIGLTSLCIVMFVTPSLVWLIEEFRGVKIPIQAQFGVAYILGHFGNIIFMVLLRTFKGVNWTNLLHTFVIVLINNKKKNEN